MTTRAKGNSKVSFVLMGAAVLVIALIVIGLWFLRAQRVAAQTLKQYQQLMSLTPLNNPPKAAPNFTLKDQNGKSISLSSFKGKTVVLEFMDPVCTDVCPIVSQEIVKANQLLGQKSNQVVYIAVNVNQYHESQSDVMAFSKEHGLNKLPNWHFLTGPTSQLKKIWQEYGVEVVPNPSGDVQHSSIMYFIGKKGMEKYIANPTNKASQITEWGKGISSVVNTLV